MKINVFCQKSSFVRKIQYNAKNPVFCEKSSIMQKIQYFAKNKYKYKLIKL